MAMTKKEQAEMEALRTRLALHFYPKVEPDILPPLYFDVIENGYTYNVYLKRVEKACTSRMYHSYGQWDKTSSQGSIELYSTPKLAYMAMLHDMADMYAADMREVEKRMEEV
jgi:hypothetical protein